MRLSFGLLSVQRRSVSSQCNGVNNKYEKVNVFYVRVGLHHWQKQGWRVPYLKPGVYEPGVDAFLISFIVKRCSGRVRALCRHISGFAAGPEGPIQTA